MNVYLYLYKLSNIITALYTYKIFKFICIQIKVTRIVNTSVVFFFSEIINCIIIRRMN